MLLDFLCGLWLSVCLSALGTVTMNIFYLDSNPQKAAEYHHDVHLRKMILETSQLLSTAHHVLGSSSHSLSNVYKKTHVSHPSAIWVRQNRATYQWGVELLNALHEEYRYRFDKTHASLRVAPFLAKYPFDIGVGDLIPPPLCMPDEYKTDDAVESYRNYYRKAKMQDKNGKSLAFWTRRSMPSWLEIENNILF